MADIPIISRDSIRAMARRAFERGLSIDDHAMNHDAIALPDWLEEFKRCQVEAKWIRETDREVAV